MNQMQNDIEEIDPTELPVTSIVTVQRRTGYGRVADLEEEEPADIHELQCLAAWNQYGPLLALPGKYGQTGRVVLGDDGDVDWERIGPAGGRRQRPQLGGTVQGEIRHALGLINLLMERVPGTAKYTVLKLVRMGILQAEHITNADLRAVSQLEARARRLQQALAARSAAVPSPVTRRSGALFARSR